MQQISSWETDRCSPSQEISNFCRISRFITAFTSAATFPYPKPALSTQYPTSQFLKIYFNIIQVPNLISPSRSLARTRFSVRIRGSGKHFETGTPLVGCPRLPLQYIRNLLTPHSTVVLEKLTGLQLVKKFPTFLWNPNVHYHIQNFPPLFPILSHLSPVHTTTSLFFQIYLNL
jgi:hypothetical protein